MDPGKRYRQLPGGHLDNVNRSIPAAECKLHPVGRNGQGQDILAARGNFSAMHCAIILQLHLQDLASSRHNDFARRQKRDLADQHLAEVQLSSSAAAQGPKPQGARRRVVQERTIAAAGGHDLIAIGRERDRGERLAGRRTSPRATYRLHSTSGPFCRPTRSPAVCRPARRPPPSPPWPVAPAWRQRCHWPYRAAPRRQARSPQPAIGRISQRREQAKLKGLALVKEQRLGEAGVTDS